MVDQDPSTKGGLGIYVHVPFCASRCDYCAFATWAGIDYLAPTYVNACLAQLEDAYAHGLGAASSVFVGGGTPSRLPAGELVRVLAAIRRQEGAEVTIEANPEDVSTELLTSYAEAGVTRISIGVQSLVPHVLASLGRRHGPDAVVSAVHAIGEVGFASFNVDLIYGAHLETDADWIATLQGVLALEPSPPHVSAYALQAEPGTALWRDQERHPDDDIQARRYEIADAILGDGGLDWYEISNWARPGHECRHNYNYWRQGEYLGIGCAAHSHFDGRRFWNISAPERYVEAIGSKRSPVAGDEHLSPAQRKFEALELALRTRDGVPEAALSNDDMLEGLIERRGGRAVLTVRGRLLANEVACRLRSSIEEP